jgi:negative regulator of replication initiation
VGVIGSVARVAGSAAALVYGLVPLLQSRREIAHQSEAVGEPPAALDERLDKLSASFGESARLVEQISAELDARAVTARQLEQRAQDATALAAQHEEQVEAMRRLLRSEMKAELTTAERHILRDSLKVAIASFALGAAASVLITLLVHPV